MIFSLVRMISKRGMSSSYCQQMYCRALSSSVSKSSVARVRQMTGVAINKCFAALKKFNQNEEEAIAWLKEQAEKEGWTKAQKLKDRDASQGLVGLLIDNNMCAAVKVNCETDFVTRNKTFHELMVDVCHAVLHLRRSAELSNNALNSLDNGDNIYSHFKEEILINRLLDSKQSADDVTLEMRVTDAVSKLGENIRITKAVTMVTPHANIVQGYVHGGTSVTLGNGCQFGQLGAIVIVKNNNNRDTELVADLAQRIAQHVVGMNPDGIGNERGNIQSNAQCLLNQPFLFDTSVTVKEALDKYNTEIIDFVRLS